VSKPLKEFLIFSDFHAHNFNYAATRVTIPGMRGLYNSRLADSAEVLDEMLEYAVKSKIKTVVFCGDLFHKRTSVNTDVRHVVVNRLHKFVEKGIQLYMIPGNHDMGDRKGYVHSLVGLGELSDHIHVYDKPSITTLKTISFVFVPYTDNLTEARVMLQKAGDLADLSNTPCVLFAHLGMQGAKVGSDYVLVNDSDVSVSDVPKEKFVACFFGHFHEHQRLFLNGWYVGATHQHNWGDSGGSRGFLHAKVYYQDKEPKLDFTQIKTNAPRFVVGREVEQVPWKSNDFIKIITDSKVFDLESVKKKMGVQNLEIVVEDTDAETEFSLDISQLSPSAVLNQWVDQKLPEHLTKEEVLNIGQDILKEVGI
jgi:DNA repair exonuclease SbcCD nuclease subunit